MIILNNLQNVYKHSQDENIFLISNSMKFVRFMSRKTPIKISQKRKQLNNNNNNNNNNKNKYSLLISLIPLLVVILLILDYNTLLMFLKNLTLVKFIKFYI